MPNINIKIRNKVAKGEYAVIVCDNSDYTAVFDFDAEWDEYTTKTARFVYGGRYTDVVFSGNECPVPVMQDTRAVTVGVFAGDLHTTTPAYFACVPSILCGNGIPADPTPDVYAQLMELLNKESGIWYPAVDDAGNMSWTRSISETEPQPVNIKGPKGDAGADGIGIPGADGKDGVDGKSAYELAQDNGFQGTMQEWLASLVGADGTNGADGKDGISPAVSVAAITGGNRITITDAEGAKTFDVMDGAQGASGADGKDYVLTDADKQEIAEAAAGLVDVPSVQPDWNQNDEAAADYVKNRPFYTVDPVETVLVEEVTLAFKDGFSGFQSTFEATVGETYKVYWDGATYECICVDFRGMSAIGNLSIMGAGSDTGEPFLAVVNNGVGIEMAAADTAASHTLSISGLAGGEVVKIDEKYLPTIPADKLPTIPADKLPTIPADKLPTIPADKLPTIPADKLPTIPVIEFTTSIAANIANDTQPFFTVSNLSYSEIYALVEKGNFQIKDSVGSNYRPIRCEIGSSGIIFVDILAFNLLGTVYANLACDADQTAFYRNRWWQIEATQK